MRLRLEYAPIANVIFCAPRLAEWVRRYMNGDLLLRNHYRLEISVYCPDDRVYQVDEVGKLTTWVIKP